MILALIPKKFNPDPRLLRVQMGPYFGICEIDQYKQMQPFMKPEYRPVVYHPNFSRQPILVDDNAEEGNNSKYANDVRLEVLIALFVSQLMATYLDTVLKQLDDSNPVGSKQRMWELVEYQMLELLKKKSHGL